MSSALDLSRIFSVFLSGIIEKKLCLNIAYKNTYILQLLLTLVA